MYCIFNFRILVLVGLCYGLFACTGAQEPDEGGTVNANLYWLSPSSKNVAQIYFPRLAGHVTIDFNDDGKKDVIAYSTETYKIHWFDDVQAFTLTESDSCQSPSEIMKMQVVDMDMDGDLDVVFTTENELYLCNNNGDGFSLERVIEGVEGIIFDIVDYDGNQELDIIYFGYRDKKILVSKNINGNFKESETVLEVNFNLLEARILDINRDGNIDVFAFGATKHHIYTHSGDYEYVLTLVDYGLGTCNDFFDIDNDGMMEVLCFGLEDVKLISFNENLNENYKVTILNKRYYSNMFLEVGKITYIDDGIVEVFIGDGGSVAEVRTAAESLGRGAGSPIALSLNRENGFYVITYDGGSFNYHQIGEVVKMMEGGGGQINQRAIADLPVSYRLDTDFDIENVTLSGDTGVIKIPKNTLGVNRTNTLIEFPVLHLRVAAVSGNSTVNRYVHVELIPGSVDSDNDGLINLVDFDKDGDGVPDNNDHFVFDSSEVLDSDLDGIGNNADTDDDNDGVLDYVDNAPLNASVWSVPQWNRGVITEHLIDYGITPPESFSTADIDDDGDLDILTHDEELKANYIYINSGVGSFERYELNIESPHFLDFGDIDNNGKQDFIFTDAWYGINNDRSFNENVFKLPYNSHGHSQAIVVADIDGDGDTDIAGAGRVHRYSIYENLDGTYVPHAESNGIDKFISLFVDLKDIDGDGDLDIPLHNSGGWYENLGNFTFTQRSELISTVDDVDGDGELDSIFIASLQGNFSNLKAHASLVYSSFSSYRSERTLFSKLVCGSEKVLVIDYNEDGLNDIVTNCNRGGFGVYENTGEEQFEFQKIGFFDNVFYDSSDVGITFNVDGAFYYSDFNGDGIKDFVSRNSGSQAWSWLSVGIEFHVEEYSDLIVDNTAIDEDGGTLIYEITHGADKDFFHVDSATGKLFFTSAPQYSNPQDFDKNNTYVVWLSVSDGYSEVSQKVTVYVEAAET